MIAVLPSRILFPSQLAFVLLASAISIPALAQQGQSAGASNDGTSSQGWSAADTQSTSPAAADQQPTSTPPPPRAMNAPKEGFWGHLNPLARKKWVNQRVDPLRDQLGELDEVNAKNARDIQDVDRRSQAGISRAQSAADAANQTALAAGAQAQDANGLAQNANGHVNQLNTTVNGLDQYHPITEADVAFRSGQPVLSAAARRKLDELAASTVGQQGYILDIEAHSPLTGSSGIQSSERLAEAVKRYLVVKHEIPVYRMHAVALGNARVQSEDEDRPTPVRTSSVHIRLMENSLAAQEAAPSQGVASSNGAERP